MAKRPDDGKALMILAEIDARLDRKEDALHQAQRAIELLPLSEDALDGLRILSRFAGVCARAGDASHSLEILENVVAKPSGPHYGELILDERWDPLRREPRFEKLLLSLAPK